MPTESVALSIASVVSIDTNWSVVGAANAAAALADASNASYATCQSAEGAQGNAALMLSLTGATGQIRSVTFDVTSRTGEGSGPPESSGTQAKILFGMEGQPPTVTISPPSLFGVASVSIENLTLPSSMPVTLVIQPGESPSNTCSISRIQNIVAVCATEDGVMPATCNCYTYTFNADGTPANNVTVKFQLLSGPGTAGQNFDDALQAVSAGSGDPLLSVTLVRNAKYRMQRGDGDWVSFYVPDASSAAIDELIGRDA